MSAIELVRIILGFGAFIVGIFGAMMAFDVETFNTKGNTVLLFAVIMLLVLLYLR